MRARYGTPTALIISTVQVKEDPRLSRSTTPSVTLSPRIPAPGLQHRWGAMRPVRAFTGTAASGDEVGEIWVVDESDDLAGLITWVTVHPQHRGQGYALALHRAAAVIVGQLLLDTFALGTHAAYDGVSCDELRVWDRMICSPDWHVAFAACGQVLYNTLLRKETAACK
jgi:GNAT superfamily N-acetyltransferase